MARTGKIARLPPLIFEEFNERLLNNPVASELLEWVNGLPEVKERLEKLFDGKPISDANLSVWRSEGGGFSEWKMEREKLDFIESIAGTVTKVAEKAGNRIARNTIPLAVGGIYSALSEGQSVEFTESGKPYITGIGADKLARAVAELATSEQNEDRLAQNRDKLELERKKLDLDERRLNLDEQKHRRATAELYIELCEDQRSKEIALGNETKDTKVAKLIQLWFGEMPANIGPAEFRKPKEAAAAT